MQAKTDAAATDTAALLASFGMELAAGGLLVRDWARLVALYPGW
jgi:hypothetical protein